MAKVLVISERDLTPELGTTVLWAVGVERLVAQSPTAALEAAQAFVPSLVVVDGADSGAALLVKRLRESPGTRRSSIVVVATPEHVPEDDLRHAGANLVLRAGSEPASCNATLQELLTVPHRVRASFPVRFSLHRDDGSGADWVSGHLLDASLGGILVEAPQAPEPSQILDVSLQPPEGPELRAVGQVVRVVPGMPPRFAARLMGFEGDAGRQIRELLRYAPERAFGRYEVLGFLGEGSMGRVYRAYDPMARRVVALKTLRPEHLDSAKAEEYWRRFRREAQAAARLVHPNIVTIFDVGDEFFVMELLEGPTLQAFISERGKLDPDEVRRLLGPVADALDHAHAQGTIHRDVKPANIMLLPDGRPKVMDFGVAHFTSGAITASGQIFGSPAYMAPEQITTGSVGPPTDLFSFAVLTYEALTGRKPFEGEAVTPILYNVLHTEPPAPTQLNTRLPRSYDEVFRRALAKDPAARFPSATAFLAALDLGAPSLVPSPSQPAGPVAPVDAEVATVDLKSEAKGAAWRPFLPQRKWVAAAALVAAVGMLVVGARLRTASNRFRTQPSPPGLQISSVPPGATVLVDGVEAGITPLFLTDLPVGEHSLKVVEEDYAPAELMVETTGEGPPVPLRFNLQPLRATLLVESKPAPAALEVDGRPVGNTPIAGLRLSAGTHRVSLARAGFRRWTRIVDAQPGEALRLEVQLEPSEGTRVREALRRQGWVAVGDLVELSPSVTPPRKISGEPAPYPRAALKLLLRGTVTVELTVAETGAVTAPRIVESAGEILDHALLEAVETWRYLPAETNGVKVKVRIRESQSFEPTSRRASQ